MNFQQLSPSVFVAFLFTVTAVEVPAFSQEAPLVAQVQRRSQQLLPTSQATPGNPPELVGAGELSIAVLVGHPTLGNTNLQQIFRNARWIFQSDGSFSFEPPPTGDVSRSLFPIRGIYTRNGNIIQIQGRQQGSFNTQIFIDGSIQLGTSTNRIDLIYITHSRQSQRAVRVTQTLSAVPPSASAETTNTEGIPVPSTFNISLQATTEAGSLGTLPGVLRIVPTTSPTDPNPFLVSISTNALTGFGRFFWRSYSSPGLQIGRGEFYSTVRTNGNRVVLNLNPSEATRVDVGWSTRQLEGVLGRVLANSPIGTTTVQSARMEFSIQGEQVTGAIEATGTTWFDASTTYRAQFNGTALRNGEITDEAESQGQLTHRFNIQNSLPDSFTAVSTNLTGSWDTVAFGRLELQQREQQIQGTYTARGGGSLVGTVAEGRIDFTWRDAQGAGWGFLRALPDGRRFVGFWGEGEPGQTGESLLVTRQGSSALLVDLTSLSREQLQALGTQLTSQGRCEDAIPVLNLAFEQAHQIRQDTQVPSTLRFSASIDEQSLGLELIVCYLELQEYDQLLTQLIRMLETTRARSQQNLRIAADVQGANSILNSLTGFWENRRNREMTDQERINAVEQGRSLFSRLVAYFVEAGHIPQALLASEISRARAFNDLLTQQLSPGSADQSITTPPTLNQLQTIAQERNATLVQYFIAAESSELFIWVIQPTGELQFRRQAIAQETPLVDLITSARRAMNVSGGRLIRVRPTARATAQQAAQLNQRLQQLHQLLIEPIAHYLPSDPNQPVILVPQGELFLVPFPALLNQQGQALIEQHTLLTIPALQLLDKTREQQVRIQQANLSEALLVGDPVMPVVTVQGRNPVQLPQLAGARREVEAISTLLDTQALIGEQATKTRVVERMLNAQIIHLATHGLLDEQQGLNSAIALTPDRPGEPNGGLLTAAEIAQMNLNAELVVLSACDTGQGRITGDGVIGLSRSLITAGVPSVIVSLWAVPDAPTAELMIEFYRQWQQSGNKALALRQAMLAIKNHPRYANPRNWAAFTLIGEAEDLGIRRPSLHQH